MLITPNFDLKEFVPKAIHKELGDKAVILLDPRIPVLAQKIRTLFKRPLYINDWHIDGRFEWRGYRPVFYEKCAKYSQHFFGRAIDFNIEGITPEEVQDYLIKNAAKLGITGIEKNTIGYTHIDVRNSEALIVVIKKIHTVTPPKPQGVK